MPKTKIAHVTSAHQANDLRIFEKECRSLSRNGYEVVVVGPYKESTVVDGVRIRGIRRDRLKVVRLLTAGWRALLVALRERALVYHLHDPELLVPFQVARLLGATVIFDMHENLPKAIQTKEWVWPTIRRVLASFAKASERVLLAGKPVVFAESSYVEDYPWVKHGTTILNYPKLDVLDIRADPHSKPTLAYVGLVTRDRGIMVTLEALRRLKSSGTSIACEVIGSVSPKDEAIVNAFISRNQLDVTLRGYIPPEKALPIVAKSRIGLALLQPIPNYVGSYPTKIFEYMAMGLAVLCSNFPLYRRIVEDTGSGLCVDSTDPDAIAFAMHHLIQNPDETAAMGRRGAEAVRSSFNWLSQERRLLQFYQEVLSARYPAEQCANRGRTP